MLDCLPPHKLREDFTAMTPHTPPSWQHTLLVTAVRPLRLNRRSAAAVHQGIARRDARWKPPHPTERSLKGVGATWTCSDVGWPVWTLSPPRRMRAPGQARKVVVAVHGGAFTGEILQLQWALYASWARDGDSDVVVPVYPLAPHGTAASVVPRVADLISDQVRARGAGNVGVEGDSAGAGLAMAAVQEIVRRGQQVPARMVLISPWLDVAMSDPRSRQIPDPLLGVDNLAESGRLWAGSLDPSHPLVSPLNATLAGLPQTAVYAGSRDVLYPDSVRLRERARREGADFTFDLRPGLLHAWAGFWVLPEARAVAGRMLKELTGAGGPTEGGGSQAS